MRRVRRRYPSDLDDRQWDTIKHLIPAARAGGRRRTTDIRETLNAIFYLNATGCPWRYLPENYPPWQTVYDYYRRWSSENVLEKIHEFLVMRVRLQEGREQGPSTLIVDSQSVKCHFGEHRGVDGFKKIRGRKRSIFVDTLGLVHSACVSSAGEKDHVPALKVISLKNQYRPLRAFYADGAYKPHDFQNIVKKHFSVWPTIRQTVTTRDVKDNKVIVESNLKPVRWVVERTFAWMGRYRRLNNDYERLSKHSEAMIYVAMTQLMLNRLGRKKEGYKRWT